MPVSEAQRRANAKHDKEHYEYCTVKVKKGEKSRIAVAATTANESINGYILESIKQRMERDGVLNNEEIPNEKTEDIS